MKRQILMLLAIGMAVGAWGQKIDFNIAGKTSQALQDGFVEWVVPEGVSDTKTLDGGIQVTVAAAQGTNPMDATNNDEEIRHIRTE